MLKRYFTQYNEFDIQVPVEQLTALLNAPEVKEFYTTSFKDDQFTIQDTSSIGSERPNKISGRFDSVDSNTTKVTLFSAIHPSIYLALGTYAMFVLGALFSKGSGDLIERLISLLIATVIIAIFIAWFNWLFGLQHKQLIRKVRSLLENFENDYKQRDSN